MQFFFWEFHHLMIFMLQFILSSLLLNTGFVFFSVETRGSFPPRCCILEFENSVSEFRFFLLAVLIQKIWHFTYQSMSLRSISRGIGTQLWGNTVLEKKKALGIFRWSHSEMSLMLCNLLEVVQLWNVWPCFTAWKITVASAAAISISPGRLPASKGNLFVRVWNVFLAAT